MVNLHLHNWSGWPGAFCLKCHAEHALENALADGWFDPVEGTWDTEEHRKLVQEADGHCPIADSPERIAQREKFKEQCEGSSTVEPHLPKVVVAGSNPVPRSNYE